MQRMRWSYAEYMQLPEDYLEPLLALFREEDRQARLARNK
jgi:hypothetical protein